MYPHYRKLKNNVSCRTRKLQRLHQRQAEHEESRRPQQSQDQPLETALVPVGRPIEDYRYESLHARESEAILQQRLVR